MIRGVYNEGSRAGLFAHSLGGELIIWIFSCSIYLAAAQSAHPLVDLPRCFSQELDGSIARLFSSPDSHSTTFLCGASLLSTAVTMFDGDSSFRTPGYASFTITEGLSFSSICLGRGSSSPTCSGESRAFKFEAQPSPSQRPA